MANSYNAQLRLKKISESILDDFPGIGDRRKAALLKKFGSVQRLRAASLEEIRANSRLRREGRGGAKGLSRGPLRRSRRRRGPRRAAGRRLSRPLDYCGCGDEDGGVVCGVEEGGGAGGLFKFGF